LPEQNGFATATRADDDEDFAPIDFEVNIFKHRTSLATLPQSANGQLDTLLWLGMDAHGHFSRLRESLVPLQVNGRGLIWFS
jgi:hypothetical protein